MQVNSTTSPSEAIERLLSEASRCVKCGRCLSVCPVYRELGRERGVARGKLSLIESQKGKELKRSSKKLKEIISLCLLCGACTENCPNLVEGDKIIQKARGALFSKKYPALPLKLMLQHILTSPKKMDKLHKAGKLLQPFFLKKIPAERGFIFGFPSRRGEKIALFLTSRRNLFLKSIPGKTPRRKLMLLFLWAVLATIFFLTLRKPRLKSFNRRTFGFRFPRKQECCGLCLAPGMDEIDVELAKRNIEAFEKTGSLPIVAPCSSCSAHLKHYPNLFEEGEWKERAKRFSQRVKDSSEFLAKTFYAPKGKASATFSRLTFHDPCHLRRKQGIFEAPRVLLKNIPGVEFIETGTENLCCGSGGSFKVSHYDLSRKIFQRRIKSIDEKKVDTVVTSCMGCFLQFLDGFYQEGKGIRVKHLVEILGEAFPR